MATKTKQKQAWHTHPTLQWGEGTSFHDVTVLLPFRTLKRILGVPNGRTDACKTTTVWILVGPNGATVTVYDYKATNLYDRSQPSPAALRRMDAVEWHIGGADGTDERAFRSWLLNEIRNA